MKATKITAKSLFVFFVVFLVFALERGPWAGQQAAPRQTQAQQKPVFRGGTHFVRVDAYPTSNDGHIVGGLKPEDFEVTEDGKAQTIESFDYISFPTFTPDAERHDPESQRAGFDLAADPRYRVFVVLLDVVYLDMGRLSKGDNPSASPDPATQMHDMQQPLVRFIDRVLGPMDLFGFLTTAQSAKDLVLGQKTTSVQAQITDLWRASLMERDRDLERFDACRNGNALKSVYRVDRTYTALESLVTQLGSLREERKNVIYVAHTLSRAKPGFGQAGSSGGEYPKAGITRGRVTIGEHENGFANDQFCNGETQRLASIDFDERYRDLLTNARRQNVAFYTIDPAGLQPTPPSDNLISLAHETDGITIVNTNDLTGGMQKIADDLSAYYVLGYYTTNTTWDGGIRRIKVRLTSSGQTIRARREYRAPTQAEIAALASPPAAPAHPSPGPPALIDEPVAFRVALRQAPEKSTRLEFARTDRLRVEFPVLAPLDRREARVLDSAGKPLPIDLPISESAAADRIVVELPLAPFAHGVYAIELTAGAAGKTEQRRLTFTVK